ncbi:MAG: C10 family peptidase [Bacteroidales bacterium]|nr:C10 family peptidase [Bacteroidales bacterium]
MKHLFLSLAFCVLFFTACSQVDEYSSFDESAKQPSYNISLSEISRIDFSGIVSPQTKTGGMQSKVITPVVEGLDTLLFIINYENDGGWVLASADKRVPLINARSKTGHFDLETAAQNKALMTWIDGLKESIRYLKQNPSFVPDSSALACWETPATTIKTKGDGEGDAHEGEWLQLVYAAIGTDCHYDIDHLMDTQWGPGTPWNNCFPFDGNGNRCSTSSGVVALAQLAYYHHYFSGKPQTAYEYGTCTTDWYQTSDLQLFNSSSNNWALMPADSSSSSSSGKQAVAALMAQIGQATGTLYSPNGTLTLITNSLSYLSYIGLSYSGFINYSNNEHQVLYDLQHNWPVYVVFHNSLGSQYDAVIDGIIVYAQRETYYYQWMPIGTYPPVEPEYPDLEHPELYEIYDYWGDNTGYWCRVNWGQDGAYNNGEYNLSTPPSFLSSSIPSPSPTWIYYNIH